MVDNSKIIHHFLLLFQKIFYIFVNFKLLISKHLLPNGTEDLQTN